MVTFRRTTSRGGTYVSDPPGYGIFRASGRSWHLVGKNGLAVYRTLREAKAAADRITAGTDPIERSCRAVELRAQA